jgi:uncharacterized RDD family membrane protein YckC
LKTDGKSMESNFICKKDYDLLTDYINLHERKREMTLNLKYADFNARMLAHNIDLVILLPFFYLIGWFTENNLLLILSCWVCYTLYHILFEFSRWHATPGKKIQKIVVVDAQGTPTNGKQIISRNLTKIISILLLFAGIIMIAFDAKRRGLHDRLAKTVVIFI